MEHHSGLIPIGRRPRLAPYLSDIWSMRAFIVELAEGQMQARHHEAALGRAWWLLNPLVSAAIYFVVFGVVLDARRGVENYPAFLVVGLFTFLYTRRTAEAGARVIQGNARVLRVVMFPRSVLPIAVTVRELSTHIPAVLVMLTLLAASGVAITWSWLLIIPALVIQTVFNLGLALLLARAAHHLDDVRDILPHALRLWLYGSGVLFSIDLVTDRIGAWAGRLAEANPMWLLVEIVRGPLLTGSTTPGHWVAASTWAVVLAITGLVVFRGAELEYGRG